MIPWEVFVVSVAIEPGGLASAVLSSSAASRKGLRDRGRLVGLGVCGAMVFGDGGVAGKGMDVRVMRLLGGVCGWVRWSGGGGGGGEGGKGGGRWSLDVRVLVCGYRVGLDVLGLCESLERCRGPVLPWTSAATDRLHTWQLDVHPVGCFLPTGRTFRVKYIVCSLCI